MPLTHIQRFVRAHPRLELYVYVLEAAFKAAWPDKPWKDALDVPDAAALAFAFSHIDFMPEPCPEAVRRRLVVETGNLQRLASLLRATPCAGGLLENESKGRFLGREDLFKTIYPGKPARPVEGLPGYSWFPAVGWQPKNADQELGEVLVAYIEALDKELATG